MTAGIWPTTVKEFPTATFCKILSADAIFNTPAAQHNEAAANFHSKDGR